MKKKIIIVLIFVGIIIYNCFSFSSSKTIIIEKNNYKSGATFEWSSLQVVNDMDIGINLSFALDRRDGKNRAIEYFNNDPDVKKGLKTADDAYLEYYQTLDLSNLQLLTEDMIKTVKAAGYKAIRLPVTWKDHLYYINDAGEKVKGFDAYDFGFSNDLDKQMEIISKLKIEEVWMERVKEVVGWILDNDMYCIINAHGDVGQEKSFNVKDNPFDKNETAVSTRIKSWIYIADSKDKTVENGNTIYNNEPRMNKYKAALGKLWTEIGNSFKDYGPKLLFEGFNEIRVERCPDNNCESYYLGEGQRADTNVTQKELEWLNDLNAIFVDAVRNTGGNNSQRFLVINTYLAELSNGSLRYFTIPNDSANHIIMAAHLYDHFSSCNDEADEYYKCVMNNGSDCETNKNYCTPSEISVPGNAAISTDENSEEESRKKPSVYYKFSIISQKAKELNVPIIIGEFATYLDDTDSYHLDKERAVLSHNYYFRTAFNFGNQLGNYLSSNSNLNGIVVFYWDDATTRFKLLNERRPRKSDMDKPTWIYPKMVDAMMKGKDGLTVLLNDDPNDMSVEPESIIVNEDISSLKIGDTIKLNAYAFPRYADKNLDISYASSDSNIITVSESGELTALAVGNAKITLSTVNGVTTVLNIQVCDENNICPTPVLPDTPEYLDVDNTSRYLNIVMIIVGLSFIAVGACIYILFYKKKVDKV